MSSIVVEPVEPELRMLGAGESAREAVAGLRRGGRIVGATKGQFSLHDLVAALLEVTGPAHCSISTWTIGLRSAAAASHLLTTRSILSLRLLVDRSFPTCQPAYCAAVRRAFGDDAIRLSKTHAKIVLLASESGWRVVVLTSANLNVNPQIEHFSIEDSGAVFGFYDRLFAEIAEATPPGVDVPDADVLAVFERIGRGTYALEGVAVGLSRAELLEAGVPLDDAPAMNRWINVRLAQNRGARHGLRHLRNLAVRVGVDLATLTAAIRVGMAPSLAEDVARALGLRSVKR